MKTFKQLIAEVAQPKGDDELNFKQKHSIEVIDHPVSKETQHSAEKRSPRRRADYDEGEDEDVYEAKLDPVGKEDGDIDNDGDKDDSDDYLLARRKAIAKAMKEALVREKKLDPVGKEDDDIDNDGDVDSSDEYLHTRRKAITKAMKEEVDSKYIARALDAINARITKPGQSPRHPSYEKAPTDIKNAVMNLAKQYAKQKNEEVELIEKAVSQAQQQAAGAALAVKRGDKPKSALFGASKEMYKMSEKDLEDFAKTKHKGLPQKVDEADDFAGWIAMFNGKKLEISKDKAKDLYGAKMYAAKELRVPKAKMGLLAIKAAYNEETDLTENFNAGATKLNDGSSVIVKEADAKLMNQLFKELSGTNRDAMMKTAMKDKKGFNEILGFAKEAL
jgi:hypothetical protein